MKGKKITNYIFIIIFIIFLYIPSISYFFAKDYIKIDNTENRNLTPKPELSFKTITLFPSMWDSYYNDNLPYRTFIINNFRNLNYYLFDDSLDDRILIGKNEKDETWLFYDTLADCDEISFIDGRKELDYPYLDSSIAKMKEETKELKKKNVELYYIIGPNKSTVYKEYLPKQIKTKKDYFLKVYEYLTEHGIDNMFYSIDILYNKNNSHETYYRTDTHWNNYGAYVYAKEFLKGVYKEDVLKPSNIDDTYIESIGKDLHNFSGFSFKILDNNTNIVYDNYDVTETEITENYGSYTVYENKKYKYNDTILLVGDSFKEAIAKDFCSLYKRVIKVNIPDYNSDLINKYNPSKIYYVRVERSTPETLFFDF